MLRLPDRSVNVHQLGKEIAALNLPDFTGVARLSRDVYDDGRAILENGVPRKIAPYILVKSAPLSAAQKAAVTAAVSVHTPAEKAPKAPRFESDAEFIETADTLADLKIALATWVRRM